MAVTNPTTDPYWPPRRAPSRPSLHRPYARRGRSPPMEEPRKRTVVVRCQEHRRGPGRRPSRAAAAAIGRTSERQFEVRPHRWSARRWPCPSPVFDIWYDDELDEHRSASTMMITAWIARCRSRRRPRPPRRRPRRQRGARRAASTSPLTAPGPTAVLACGADALQRHAANMMIRQHGRTWDGGVAGTVHATCLAWR